jgi:hypothetical protein
VRLTAKLYGPFEIGGHFRRPYMAARFVDHNLDGRELEVHQSAQGGIQW